MPTSDDVLANSTVGVPWGGTPIDFIYMQLKLISLILKEAYDITDDDFMMLQATAQTLNPNTPSQLPNE